MPWTFHRWRACGFWHCSMTAGWKQNGMWVLTLHQMFFFSTRKKSQEYFFCFSFNLLPAVIFAAPHFLPVPLAIIFLYLLLFLIRVITCTICGLKWPKSRAMTTIRPLQWVFSFPEAYCQNFMLLQACSVFAATAKSYLHNASRYASNIFKTSKSLNMYVYLAFMCLLYEETVSTAVKTLFRWQFGICRRDRKIYTL